MRDFRKFEIWKHGMSIVKRCYGIANLLPDNEKFGLFSQIKRASVSIPSNIAEGSSRSTDLDFKRFLEFSLGSSFEIETQLILINELNLISDNQELDSILIALSEFQRMTNSFITKLKATS